MNAESLISRGIEKELVFSYSRSSGPGGQNVNKVNTRVELRFNVGTSSCLGLEEKEILFIKLKSKLSKERELIIISQSERSQLKNRDKAVERFLSLLAKSLTPQKKRKLSSPSISSKEKRLENKRIKSGKKIIRRKTDLLNE